MFAYFSFFQITSNNACLATPLRTASVKTVVHRMLIAQLNTLLYFNIVQYAMSTPELIIVCTTKERTYYMYYVYFENKRIAMQRFYLLVRFNHESGVAFLHLRLFHRPEI